MKIGIIAAALAFVGLSAVAQTNQKTEYGYETVGTGTGVG